MHVRRLFYYTSSLVLAVAVLTLTTGDAFSAPKKKKRTRVVPAKKTDTPLEVVRAKAVRTEGPNVLFILVEGLGDWTGWQKAHPEARTLNLDRLARLGVSFPQSYAASSWENPSRTALLMGMWPWQSAVTDPQVDWRRSGPVIGKMSLPEVFRVNGFHVVEAGRSFDTLPASKAGYGVPAAWDAALPLTAQQASAPDGGNAALVEQLPAFLQEQRSEPFFLLLNLRRPAALPQRLLESDPAQDAVGTVIKADDLEDVPAIAQPEKEKGKGGKKPATPEEQQLAAQAVIQQQVALAAYYDEQIGKVLDALAQSPQAATTAVVFTTDRGAHAGEKGRASGGSLWEDGSRVPLVIAIPGVTTAGAVCESPVSLVDVFPTLCAALKMTTPDYLTGQSLLPQLSDPTAPITRPALTSQGAGDQADIAVRDARWRYIRYRDGSEELYDHQSDPQEWTNVAALPEHAATKQSLAAALPKMWASPTRALAQVQTDTSPDGSIIYALEQGDVFESASAPNLKGRAFEAELIFSYNAERDADSTLLAQGDAKLGYAIHLVEGRPAVTVNYDGLRATVKTVRALPATASSVTLRVLMGRDGTLALSSLGGMPEARGYAPMGGGFPRQPEHGLTVGKISSVLPSTLFPKQTAFQGNLSEITLHLLPTLEDELRASTPEGPDTYTPTQAPSRKVTPHSQVSPTIPMTVETGMDVEADPPPATTAAPAPTTSTPAVQVRPAVIPGRQPLPARPGVTEPQASHPELPPLIPKAIPVD